MRQYAEEKNWTAAMDIVNAEIARNPKDADIRAWRARLLTWSGHLAGAEQEYLRILGLSRNDPDIWLGLSQVYVREGKTQQASQAIAIAESLAPGRADIHAEHGRILEAAGEPNSAKSQFQLALKLDPANSEARAGLVALRGEPSQTLRVGQENDVFSYAGTIHDEYASLTSRWTSRWTTNASGYLYQYYGIPAEKFLASATRREPVVGAITVGGAIAHDNAVIPRNEAFFGFDRGAKIGDATIVRGVEFAYEQHWYWYESARVLTLAGTSTFYLPQDWTLSLGATGARSAFSATESEWKPSEITRLKFPISRWGERTLFGNLLFAAGTEDFAQVDQIGALASQTYGSGLRFQFSPLQSVSEYVSYQKWTRDKSDISCGLSYDLNF